MLRMFSRIEGVSAYSPSTIDQSSEPTDGIDAQILMLLR